MRGSSEVCFVLVFTVFFRCWTFGASNARRTEKLRKNCCFGLENRGLGRPGEARASKFERQNGQVGRKSALEAPPGAPNFFLLARTRQLRAEMSAQCPRCASGPPKPASAFFGIFEWMSRLKIDNSVALKSRLKMVWQGRSTAMLPYSTAMLPYSSLFYPYSTLFHPILYLFCSYSFLLCPYSSAILFHSPLCHATMRP